MHLFVEVHGKVSEGLQSSCCYFLGGLWRRWLEMPSKKRRSSNKKRVRVENVSQIFHGGGWKRKKLWNFFKWRGNGSDIWKSKSKEHMKGADIRNRNYQEWLQNDSFKAILFWEELRTLWRGGVSHSQLAHPGVPHLTSDAHVWIGSTKRSVLVSQFCKIVSRQQQTTA